MKVIHILNELKFSGAEIMYVSAAKEFAKMGCELTVVNTGANLGEYAVQFEKAGYEVLHWPYNPKNISDKIAYTKEVIGFLKSNAFDVVHIHTGHLLFLMSFSAWRANCKIVYTFHNVYPTRWFSYPLHLSLRWIIKNILGCKYHTISDSVYEHEKRLYLNNTHKINNWYNSATFYPAADFEKTTIRKQLGISEDALVVISIGGCSHIKRHSDIISAMPVIREKYPNTLYLHLGEGSTLQEEQGQAKDLGLKEHIRFEGNQTDVRKYLIASDIYVMPSKFEGISLTTIEAMVCEIPAVLYDVPGLRDFNKTVTCAKIIPEDYQELARAIIELHENKSEQQLLVTNGKVFVDREFNMAINAKKIVELYLE